MVLADRLDERPIRASQYRILALMVVLLMVEGLDLQLLGQVAPVILYEWHVPRGEFGLAMGAALVGLALGAGIGGPLGDRYGRKRVLMVCAAIFACGTAAAALAQNIPQLAAIRLISGLAFGAASPVSIALVAEWLPRRIQPTAVALMTVGTPLGGMVGSVLMIWLLPLLGWRGCFIACGLLTVVLTVLTYVFMPESPSYLAAKRRTGEALALLRRYVDADFAEADLVAVSAKLEDAPAKEGPLSPLYRRLTLGAWLLFFAAQFIAYSMITWGTVMLGMGGLPLVASLLGATAFNGCGIIATVVAGPIVQRFGSRTVVMVGSVLTLASLVALLSSFGAKAGDVSPWAVILYIGGIGTFISLTMVAGYALITMGYAERTRSTGIGVALMIGRMGGGIAALFGGLLLSVAGDQVYPLIGTLIALTFVAFAGGWIIDRHVAPRMRAS